METCTAEPRPTFSSLPEELQLHVFSFLDVPDLLAISRTTLHLRSLSLDPQLHMLRRRLSSLRLSSSLSLPQRPSASSISPPSSTILLSGRHVLARSLSRQLIAIRLKRKLSRRPEASALVEKNVLPQECCGRSDDGKTAWLAGKGVVSPRLVGVKRAVERERVKDGLRGSLERKREAVERETRKERDERKDVRYLIRRFTARANSWRDGTAPRAKDGARWGEVRSKRKDEPARAHVLGLKRFWEGLASGAQSIKM